MSAGYVANLVFKDYAQPGDKMTISFNPATKKITSLNVNTYMDNPKDVVTLAVTVLEPAEWDQLCCAECSGCYRQEVGGDDDELELSAGRAAVSAL